MKKICWIILLVCALTGCSPARKPAGIRVVERITVSEPGLHDAPVRVYSDSRKMGRILNYLRSLERRAVRPGEAEESEGDTYLITLHHSDGSRSVYRQKGGQYLHRRGLWQKIPPEQAQHLPLLLAAMPPD